MELTIKINLNNAAFEDDPGAEVARILRDLMASWHAAHQHGFGRTLRDINGNVVGRAEVGD